MGFIEQSYVGMNYGGSDYIGYFCDHVRIHSDTLYFCIGSWFTSIAGNGAYVPEDVQQLFCISNAKQTVGTWTFSTSWSNDALTSRYIKFVFCDITRIHAEQLFFQISGNMTGELWGNHHPEDQQHIFQIANAKQTDILYTYSNTFKGYVTSRLTC